MQVVYPALSAHVTQVRKAHNMGQESLGAFFGINDQSTVSNYLKLADKYDDELYLVTPDNLTKYIATIKSEEEFKADCTGQGRWCVLDYHRRLTCRDHAS